MLPKPSNMETPRQSSLSLCILTHACSSILCRRLGTSIRERASLADRRACGKTCRAVALLLAAPWQPNCADRKSLPSPSIDRGILPPATMLRNSRKQARERYENDLENRAPEQGLSTWQFPTQCEGQRLKRC